MERRGREGRGGEGRGGKGREGRGGEGRGGEGRELVQPEPGGWDITEYSYHTQWATILLLLMYSTTLHTRSTFKN